MIYTHTNLCLIFFLPSLFQLFLELPLFVFELVEFVGLPVHRDHRPARRIRDGRDLEREDVVFNFTVCLPQRVSLSLQEECLIREGPVETSHDQNLEALACLHFAHTAPLSRGQELRIAHLKGDPLFE